MSATWEAQQVLLRLARCADLLDVETMTSYFDDAAVMEVGDRTVSGRAELLRYFGGGGSSTPRTDRTKHVITNTVIAPSGDELMATSYFQVLRSWGLATWGRYEDRLAAVDGTWKVMQRRVHVDGQISRPERPPTVDSSPG